MFGVRATGSEKWLRAICLAASVGLHAGLGILGWQGLATTSSESLPIMVSLAESPGDAVSLIKKAASSGIAVRAGGPVRKTAPSLSSRTPAPQPVASVPPEPVAADVLQCALPETTIVETVAVSAEPEPAAESGAGGGGIDTGAADGPATGPSIGTAAGKGGGGGDPAGRLVLAKPRYASNPKPEYPRLARQNHWEGVVSLRVAISAGGEVESVAVESSSGYQVLDNSAVGGVRRWRFVPARRGDLRVPCEVRIPVAFQLDR